MRNLNILANFLGMFPQYQETIKAWTPRKNSTITVELQDGSMLDFMYKSSSEWALTTIPLGKTA